MQQVIVAYLLFAVFYLLIQWGFGKKWDKGLDVRVYCERDCAYEGDTLILVEEVANQKAMLLPAVKVKFATSKEWKFKEESSGITSDQYYRNDLFSIGMYERIKRSFSFTCNKRGYYALGNVDVFVSSYFYSREYVMRKKQQQSIYVFPKRVQAPVISMYVKQMLGQTLAKRKLYEDPFMFQGIRDYQNYDSMGKINWKSSAKTGELKVNCYAHTAEQEVKLLLYFDKINAEIDRTMEEYAISLAATLAECFLERHIVVAMVTNGLDIANNGSICVGAGAGSQHMRQIDEGLARIDLHKNLPFESEKSFFQRELKGDKMYVVITTSRTVGMQKSLIEEAAKDSDLVWVLPHYAIDQLQIASELQDKVIEIIADEELG